MTLVICYYFVMLFTDFTADSQQRYQIGWIFIIVVCINAATNFLIIMVITIRAFIDKIKEIIEKIRNFRKKKLNKSVKTT